MKYDYERGGWQRDEGAELELLVAFFKMHSPRAYWIYLFIGPLMYIRGVIKASEAFPDTGAMRKPLAEASLGLILFLGFPLWMLIGLWNDIRRYAIGK